MKLERWEWELIAHKMLVVGGIDSRALEIVDKLGEKGENAITEGMDAADPLAVEPADWKARGQAAIDEMVAEVAHYAEMEHNLWSLLENLSARLVTEEGFAPATMRFNSKSDGHLLRTTDVIAAFTAWVNRVPEAREILSESGFDWTLGRQQGREDRACNFA
jgi:hypothetical protein